MAKLHWKMTTQTYQRYLDLTAEMLDAAQSDDQLRLEAAMDQFRSLPGYNPGFANLDDHVVPVLIETEGIIYSLPTKH